MNTSMVLDALSLVKWITTQRLRDIETCRRLWRRTWSQSSNGLDCACGKPPCEQPLQAAVTLLLVTVNTLQVSRRPLILVELLWCTSQGDPVAIGTAHSKSGCLLPCLKGDESGLESSTHRSKQVQHHRTRTIHVLVDQIALMWRRETT